jgi:hypothetical protein
LCLVKNSGRQTSGFAARFFWIRGTAAASVRMLDGLSISLILKGLLFLRGEGPAFYIHPASIFCDWNKP